MPEQESSNQTSESSKQAELQNDEVREAPQEQSQQEETPVAPTEGSKRRLDPANEPEYTSTPEEGSDEMPEYLKGMDKFWNQDKGLVEVEKLSESYRNLEGKLGQRKEELAKELEKEYNENALADVPENPDAYKLNLPEGDYNDEQKNYMEESPVWQYFKKTAHDNKMNQNEVDSMVNMYMEAQKAELPDPNVEMAALGDNANARVEAVQLWTKKHLDEEGYAAVEHLCSTAQGIQTMEQIMQSIADPSIGDLQGAAVNSSATEADLKSLMADPRYSDPNKRDIAYVNYVTEQFNKKYGEEPAGKGSTGKLG